MGDVVNFFSGLTYHPSDVKNKGYFVIRSSNIQNNQIVSADDIFVNKDIINVPNVKQGDIIVVVRNGSRKLIGKHAQVLTDMPNTVIGAFMTGVRSKSNFYINALLDSDQFQKEIYKNLGATINQITIGEFRKMRFIITSGNEAQTIGEFFKKIDTLITLQQRKLDLLKQFKKGLLQKMFADKSKFPILRFEGFHNEWEQRKLKNVYQKIGNAFVGTASPYYVDAGHFYLESNNIKNGQINRNHEVFINNSFYQKQSNKLLHTGDLVMVQSGHVGDTAVITQEYNNSAAHALIVFRNPKDKFLSDYLNFYFQNTSAKNKINILAIGNTIRHVLASDMSRFSVYFPNKDERKYISNLLLKLQYTITLQQSKISQLTILKKYLLQKLFI